MPLGSGGGGGIADQGASLNANDFSRLPVIFRVWQRTMAAVVTDERIVALLRKHRTVEDCRIHRRGSDPLSASACRTIKTQEAVTGAEAVTALIAVHSVQCGWQGRDRWSSQSVKAVLTAPPIACDATGSDVA